MQEQIFSAHGCLHRVHVHRRWHLQKHRRRADQSDTGQPIFIPVCAWLLFRSSRHSSLSTPTIVPFRLSSGGQRSSKLLSEAIIQTPSHPKTWRSTGLLYESERIPTPFDQCRVALSIIISPVEAAFQIWRHSRTESASVRVRRCPVRGLGIYHGAAHSPECRSGP